MLTIGDAVTTELEKMDRLYKRGALIRKIVLLWGRSLSAAAAFGAHPRGHVANGHI